MWRQQIGERERENWLPLNQVIEKVSVKR
jgi:hypothetical protein